MLFHLWMLARSVFELKVRLSWGRQGQAQKKLYLKIFDPMKGNCTMTMLDFAVYFHFILGDGFEKMPNQGGVPDYI